MVLEKTLESPLDYKEIQPVHPKGDQSWVFTGRTDIEAEIPILWPPDAELTHLKRPWCWERLRAGGKGDDRGWDGWMASLTRWTWVWVNSGSWWWTGRPGVAVVHGVTKSRTRLSDLESICLTQPTSLKLFYQKPGLILCPCSEQAASNQTLTNLTNPPSLSSLLWKTVSHGLSHCSKQ